MNKKAQSTAILLWMILSFITVVFFAAWVYGFGQVTDVITGMSNQIGTNETIGSVATQTFGEVNSAQTTGLHVLAFVMIVSTALSILITNFIVKAHPVFFIVHIFVNIGAVMGATILANTYEELLANRVLGATLGEFSAASFIMINLPIWVAVIGIFGAIFLFAGILRDSGAGGSVL